MKPTWCVKQSPCDYDDVSAYCPHRECRKSLESFAPAHAHAIANVWALGLKSQLPSRVTIGGIPFQIFDYGNGNEAVFVQDGKVVGRIMIEPDAPLIRFSGDEPTL